MLCLLKMFRDQILIQSGDWCLQYKERFPKQKIQLYIRKVCVVSKNPFFQPCSPMVGLTARISYLSHIEHK